MPADKVRARRERSFDQMPWFFHQADAAWLFDNSGAEPMLVADKRGDDGWLGERLLPELRERLIRPIDA